jgi:hypothetical protein
MRIRTLRWRPPPILDAVPMSGEASVGSPSPTPAPPPPPKAAPVDLASSPLFFLCCADPEATAPPSSSENINFNKYASDDEDDDGDAT